MQVADRIGESGLFETIFHWASSCEQTVVAEVAQMRIDGRVLEEQNKISEMVEEMGMTMDGGDGSFERELEELESKSMNVLTEAEAQKLGLWYETVGRYDDARKVYKSHLLYKDQARVKAMMDAMSAPISDFVDDEVVFF
eukprot:TRINITY_DN3045_c0_g2_i1.p1 TRINITY_DN3045_c0_g2~~TRINITY_DN3045_c0_g2_i1.p1  ORF type:complete len:140 (-),score=43.75 TRINITY_DN3045_c0_g2_i1:1-420(-)